MSIAIHPAGPRQTCVNVIGTLRARDTLAIMSLSMDEIAAISRSVALEHGRALQVAGVTSKEGGSDRVEILVTLTGCHEDPCRIMVNVSRADRAVLESELRAVLRRAVSEHLSGAGAV